MSAVSSSGSEHSALTGTSGAYTLAGLSPGVWEVLFQGCANNVVAQWWPGQSSQTTARAVTVTEGQVTPSISAQLQPGGIITGTVTVAGSADAAASVCVYAESGASLEGLPTVAEGAAVTDSIGAYEIGGLPTGTYEVDFVPCTPSVDLQQAWWNDQSDETLANGVAVTAGETSSDVSASLQEGGEISGTVMSAADRVPLQGICATAVSASFGFEFETGYANNLPAATAVTNSAGRYTITGLAAGDYLVDFSACVGGSSGNYLTAFWRQAKQIEATPPVSVTAGKNTGDISLALEGGGSVSGVVTSAGKHRPLRDVCVLIISDSTALGAQAVTDRDGAYDAVGLPAGRYSALFSPCGQENLQGAAWHGGATFAVRPGATTTGISIALAPGGIIEGSVESVGGAPLTGLCSLLVQSTSSFESGSEIAPVGFAGTYEIAGLSPGPYSVGFDGSCAMENYLSQLWKGGATVHVKAGAVVSGIDFKLRSGGTMTGQVTQTGGRGLSAICVEAFNTSNQGLTQPLGITFTFGGRYEVVALSAGAYQVSFSPCLPNENYQAASWTGNVAVRVGERTSGISVVLATGGEISGTVTGKAGAPLSFICVTAIPAFMQQTYQAEAIAGSYVLVGLPTSLFEVEFSTCGGGGYANQWWKDAGTQEHATPIQVTAGQDTTGITAAMHS